VGPRRKLKAQTLRKKIQGGPPKDQEQKAEPAVTKDIAQLGTLLPTSASKMSLTVLPACLPSSRPPHLPVRY
jgi:hypothetical protein